MPKRVTDEQRRVILRMLAEGQDRETIAAASDVTPGQVSAISAHVKMGTYGDAAGEVETTTAKSAPEALETTTNLLSYLRSLQPAGKNAASESDFSPVWIGTDAETGDSVFWNPDAATGTANPHVLILGESGFGKTYTITCLLAELAQRGVTSVVFDYGQGFSAESLPREFRSAVNSVEIYASRDGVDINPLQIFPSDVLGPINVAQRLADTLARVYPKIGVQQHAVLRQAVLDAMEDVGIVAVKPETWSRDLPAFRNVQAKLDELARAGNTPGGKAAASVASHVSTLFVFDTFRPNGQKLSWDAIFGAEPGVVLIQLKGLEYSLERAVTELLLWNLIGFLESLGPGPLRCFAVLDEAHKLSCDRGSPVEKLLREGRKFGLGLILASQQPEDFSQVAIANTATKLVFQVVDERNVVSRLLNAKGGRKQTIHVISTLITTLPRGSAFFITNNKGCVVSVAPFEARSLLASSYTPLPRLLGDIKESTNANT